METHIDHAWLLMRGHVQSETRLHSGELGVQTVVGDGIASMHGRTMKEMALLGRHCIVLVLIDSRLEHVVYKF